MYVVEIYVHVKKDGLRCMVACDECRSESCGNSVDITEEL